MDVLTAYSISGIVSIIWMFIIKEETAGGLIGFLIYNMVLAVNKTRQCIICEEPMPTTRNSKKHENRSSGRYLTATYKQKGGAK